MHISMEQLEAILGGKAVLGRRLETFLDLVDIVRAGLSPEVVTYVARMMCCTEIDLFELMGVSTRTSYRRKAGAVLTVHESDLVVRYARIFWCLKQKLSQGPDAFFWLRTAHSQLDGRSPFEAMRVDIGARLVEELIDQMEVEIDSQSAA